LPPGEVGELIVRGPAVTREYVTTLEANPLHKIPDVTGPWHRMGDVGYLDGDDRFWFCGRKSHRVQAGQQTMFTVPCEAVVNAHPRVFRSALVGVGLPGQRRPVLVVELWPESAVRSAKDRQQLLAELWDLVQGNRMTRDVRQILLHRGLPVDRRHNTKILREQLAGWAAQQLGTGLDVEVGSVKA
jgi:acyl-coenzyme A synthetase/AMP-(fatty) acid ligase